MTALRDTLLRYIDDRLDAILSAPPMWGSDESVELQVLQLMELRALLVRPHVELEQPRAVLDTFVGLVRQKFPKEPPTPLFELLARLDRGGELASILGEFRSAVVRARPPENVFEHHDLVLVLTLKKGRAPALSLVSAAHEALRRVIRAVDGGARQDAIDLDAAMDFVLADVGVSSTDGRSTIAVTLEQPLADQPAASRAEHRVRDALTYVLIVAQWAAGALPVDALATVLPDQQMRRAIALQALRLLPHGDVEALAVGGRLVSLLSPVTFRAALADRLAAVFGEGQSSHPFDAGGVVVAVDVDQGTLQVRTPEGTRTCSIAGEHVVVAASRLVGRHVSVSGAEYRGGGRTPLVVIDAVAPAAERDDDLAAE